MATTQDELSRGYFELVSKGASDDMICDFLDSKLGVQHTPSQVVYTENLIMTDCAAYDRKTGKWLGCIGTQGFERQTDAAHKDVRPMYCSEVSCAKLNCEKH